ncbi:MAG: NlpC/P60 family protein [Dysgonomonas sp.]
MKKISLLFISLVISISAFCQEEKPIYKHAELYRAISVTEDEFIPDKRVKIFDIEVLDHEVRPTLQGITSDMAAYNRLISYAKDAYGDSFVNKVKLLPDEDLEGKTYGVINLSVADIREKPDFTEGMATQSILGTPIRIYQKDKWYRIQTPDGYIGWSQLANFHPMTKAEFNKWTLANKIIFTDYFGFSYSQPDKNSQTVSDLVNGNMLKLEGEDGDFYKVSYPDGRIAYILKSQTEPYNEWKSSIQLTRENIIKKAFTLIGIPYVWGGTSVKGMDCSGYTKSVLFMLGVILTRDASQQAYTGIPIDISKGYENLQIGDLMFFGKKGTDGKKDRIRHVGFYIGNNEFIHASGSVRISSMDKDKPNYDEVNTKEFVKASRIIGAVDTEGIWSIDNNPMYKIQK